MRPHELATFLDELCDLAEVETLPRFKGLVPVDNKRAGGFDPVTEADRAAEQVIRKRISERYPDHGIIGEEFGSSNEQANHCWIIDPIDGTRAFISGIPVWGTLIGLYSKGQPLAGIMHQPFTGERYYCDGEVSYYLHRDQESRLQTSDKQSLSDALLMTTAPELFQGRESEQFKQVSDEVRMVRFGADCYAYCLLAAGHIDLVIESGLQIYDIAALIPIIERAGGLITSWDGGSASQGGQVIAAANRELHEQAMETLNR